MTAWWEAGNKIEIRDEWFDHSPRDLDALLERCGIKRA
jgi:hypothetical protein